VSDKQFPPEAGKLAACTGERTLEAMVHRAECPGGTTTVEESRLG
jgi:hypothetical protein